MVCGRWCRDVDFLLELCDEAEEDRSRRCVPEQRGVEKVPALEHYIWIAFLDEIIQAIGRAKVLVDHVSSFENV
jgi:hypothetical protein